MKSESKRSRLYSWVLKLWERAPYSVSLSTLSSPLRIKPQSASTITRTPQPSITKTTRSRSGTLLDSKSLELWHPPTTRAVTDACAYMMSAMSIRSKDAITTSQRLLKRTSPINVLSLLQIKAIWSKARSHRKTRSYKKGDKRLRTMESNIESYLPKLETGYNRFSKSCRQKWWPNMGEQFRQTPFNCCRS